MTDAYIFDAVRSPRGKGRADGGLHELTSLALSASVLNALRDRTGLDTAQVEDVIWGCVTPVGEQGGRSPCRTRSRARPPRRVREAAPNAGRRPDRAAT